jgi:beta-lactamase superfamily II metal-dependent hydrolase
MSAKITFFPVGNGDMTLLELESGRTVLIDVDIRAAADDPDDDTPDVAKTLRDRLKRDSESRLYVDAFLLSHPDKDHCCGLKKHIHLGAPAEWSESADKIFIREIWSSPMVFRRASSNHVLCDDAAAFNCEARA